VLLTLIRRLPNTNLRSRNMSSTPPRKVLVYTTGEMMEIGLRLEGASIERQKKQQWTTLVDDFKGCYGVHPSVLAEIWVDLQINPIEADRIQFHKNTVDVFHFLKTYKFLRQYPTEVQRKVNTGRTRKTNRKWTWYFTERIKALKEHKVSGTWTARMLEEALQ
jgi:hypothetical protein